MKPTKKCVIILTSFRNLNITHNKFIKLSIELKKFFPIIFIIDVDQLKNQKRYKIYLKNINHYKYCSFFRPKNLYEFNKFLLNKNPIIINNIGRYFNDFFLLRFLKKKNYPQVVVSNLGNVQAPAYYFKGNFINQLRNIYQRKIPYFFHTVLSNFHIVSKINVRFISNKKIYEKNRNQVIMNKLSYFKKYVLVDGEISEEKKYKNTEKYIIHLDLDPDYPEITNITGDFEEEKIKDHYLKLNEILSKLEKKYKKKVIVSIHPNYNLSNAKKRFPNFKVFNKDVFKLVSNAFLVTAFDSSVIVDAIQKKKKILIFESFLFKEKNYPTSLYKNLVKLKSIEISNKKMDINNLTIKLKKKFRNYQKYIYNYLKTGDGRNPNKEITLLISQEYDKFYKN